MVKMISIEAQEKNMKGGVPNCLGEIRISLIPQIYIYIYINIYIIGESLQIFHSSQWKE